jgi:hypothetical protein
MKNKDLIIMNKKNQISHAKKNCAANVW